MTILTPDGDIADPYRNFIAKSRYSRWIPEENRRETWSESVDRYFRYMVKHLSTNHGYAPSAQLVQELAEAVKNHEIMPSMRALMTAGAALERSNVAGFNCAYLPIQDPIALDELLYILMNGTGVGFSVEKCYVDQLPRIPDTVISGHQINITVDDSKEGWGIAFRHLLHHLWLGEIPTWDLSQIRPAGSRLKTFGGRASGPEPLDALFRFTVELFRNAAGRRLRPIEVHDLACKAASAVEVGGVRRSAMISLTDLDDEEMATAKSGTWWQDHPYRSQANISAVYHDGVTRGQFDREWATLVKSESGERGIFHRDAARRQASQEGTRDDDVEYGTNPCNEIILRPFSFCNLSEAVARPTDDMTDLKRKVGLAAILGTWQSTLTDYPYLRSAWRENAEQERLLGVSLTGIYDNPILNNSIGSPLVDLPTELATLQFIAIRENALEADRIGIDASVATTCVKPSGTVSQLVDSASGLHQRHALYYIRRVRVDKGDPLARLMQDAGVPHEEDVFNTKVWVFAFPQQAPEGSVTRQAVTAIEHLELWMLYQRYWCEHKPSVTISVRPEEWEEVGYWVWTHLNDLSGIAFLPYAEHIYQQPPYEECTRQQYESLRARMPRVQWSDLPFYEREDQTMGSQELACSAGGCEAVDIVYTA